MAFTDTWKQLKKEREEYNSITNLSDILAKEMLEYAKIFEDHEESNVDTVSVSPICDDILSLIQDKVIGSHSKICFDAKHQLQCIWCSKVNLLQWKTTLKCRECGKVFAEIAVDPTVGQITCALEVCQLVQREDPRKY